MMRRILALAISLLLVSWTEPGEAAQSNRSNSAKSASADEKRDWWWVTEFGKAPDRRENYVDRNSLRVVQDRYVGGWALTIPEQPLQTGQAMWAHHVIFDCANRKMSYSAYTEWDKNGIVLKSLRVSDLPFTKIKDDPEAEAVRRYMCRDYPLPSIAAEAPLDHAMAIFGRKSYDIIAPESVQAKADSVGEATSGYGTGFFVNATGDIVTSFHVIDGASTVHVLTEDGKKHEARVVRSSPTTDLAVLHIDLTPAHYLTLAPANSSRSGDRVFTYGFPVIEMLGGEPKYTDGAISSLSGLGGEAAFAQISVPVQPGNSGGPVVNEQGAVVGVVAAQAAVEAFANATGVLPQNVNWAVRSEYILPLIGNLPAARVLSREQALSQARRSVVIIQAERGAGK